MNVKHLRIREPVTLLKNEEAWTASEETQTEIKALPNGHFLVKRFGKVILVGAHLVKFAELDGDPTLPLVVKKGAIDHAKLKE